MSFDEFRKMIFAREGGYCLWCGAKAGDLAHLKHYGAGRKRSSGVMDWKENACALCRTCHTMYHSGKHPNRRDLMKKMVEKYGYVYTEAEWAAA